MAFQGNKWTTPTTEEVQYTQSLIDNEKTEEVIVPPDHVLKAMSRIAEPSSNQIAELLKEGPVDIIIPVYNGLHVVEPCIRTLYARTKYPFNLYVSDDASDEVTQAALKDLQAEFGFELLLSRKNKGFAGNCNKGIQAGSNKNVILLNSDVLVTEGWLTKMMQAMIADPRNAIVNPATNNTAMVNIPMQEGMSYQDMNRAREILTTQEFPPIIPSGFCFMFKREVVEKVGLLDEAYGSYGEETDFWMRALKCIDSETGKFMDYRSVIADNAYVYHERGSSFSAFDESAWMKERETGSKRFHLIHPDFKTYWYDSFNIPTTMTLLRQEIQDGLKVNPEAKFNVAFVTYSTAFCGGMKMIADIVNEMIEQGIDAKVVKILRPDERKDQVNVLGELRTCPVIFESIEDFHANFAAKVFSKGIIFAATAELGPPVLRLAGMNPEQYTPALYAQSYDMDFVPNEESRAAVKEIYNTFPHIIANSHYVEERFAQDGVGLEAVIYPGVEQRLFYPRGRENGDERPTLMVMLNAGTAPGKGVDRGIQIIRAVNAEAKARKLDIRILVAGVESVKNTPYAIGLGNLSQPRLANLLGTEVDVLLDPATHHSYGMPAVEALASGCQVVTLNNGGDQDLESLQGMVRLEEEELSPESVANIILDLLEKELGNGTVDPKILTHHNRQVNIQKFIDHVRSTFIVEKANKKVTFITPHVRKHGGPTTLLTTANELSKRGYDVNMVSIYDDNPNMSLLKMAEVPVYFNKDHAENSDLIFINSDSDQHEWVQELPGKKIMIKLSHNARFKALEEAGINAKYDRIITSSQWLTDVTKKPLTDWNHEAKDATCVGWYNYGFEQFNANPTRRRYNKLGETPVMIVGLLHAHPLKGTQTAIDAFTLLHQKYGDQVKLVGIGEGNFNVPKYITPMLNMTRANIAALFQNHGDVWLGCSHTEGLGRLGLEAMSAGMVCVLSDTGAEYVTKENALTFPIGDYETASAQVEAALTDQDLFAQLVLQGHATAKKYADPTKYIDNIETVIQELYK